MYSKVKYENGLFTAKDEMGRTIYIHESISFIYRAAINDEAVRHIPVTYHDTAYLQQLENYLLGKAYDPDVISHMNIRYGWLDKRLEKTEFINIKDFMDKFRNKTATSKDRSKLTAICKQLSISKKDVL